MSSIAIVNPKGGVGKSLLAILLTEWMGDRGISVELVDADQNGTVSAWQSLCVEKGREVGTGSDLRIIDTAGLHGSVAPHLDSELLICPFEPSLPALRTVLRWTEVLSLSQRQSLVLVPNRLSFPLLTVAQKAALDQARQLLVGLGLGRERLFPGLMDRKAVYGGLYHGHAKNFFEWTAGGSVANAQNEARAVFEAVEKVLMERLS